MSRLIRTGFAAALIVLALGIGATHHPATGQALAAARSSATAMVTSWSVPGLPVPGERTTSGDATPALLAEPKVTPFATPCVPAIEFTQVPAYATQDNLGGRTRCLEPAAYRVAVYIYTSGWWNKPTWAAPLTALAADGTWSTDVITGDSDQYATRYAAFVVSAGYAAPLMSGGQQLPDVLYQDAAAWAAIERPASLRTIAFSGYTWDVKASDTAVGPGPNRFSDDPADVWVDNQGRLHLRVAYRDGHWYCTEVVSQASFGYGQYTFRLAERARPPDENLVLGLFTWDTLAPQYHYREIDIEISRWGDAANQNTQFVVQPWDHPGNLYRFDTDLAQGATTHRFRWLPQQILFDSLAAPASPGEPGAPIASWTYAGADLPPAGGENARINFWLMDGLPPTDGLEDEIVIEAFQFTPLEVYLPVIQRGVAYSNPALLQEMQRRALAFFWQEADAQTGLIQDRASNFQADTYDVASIASVGSGLVWHTLARCPYLQFAEQAADLAPCQ